MESSLGEELFHPSPIDFTVESRETLYLKFLGKRGRSVMRPVSDGFLFFKCVVLKCLKLRGLSLKNED